MSHPQKAMGIGGYDNLFHAKLLELKKNNFVLNCAFQNFNNLEEEKVADLGENEPILRQLHISRS